MYLIPKFIIDDFFEVVNLVLDELIIRFDSSLPDFNESINSDV